MAARKETKAQRIYGATRRECRNHIQTWGKPEGGFTGLIADSEDYERMSGRTFNDVEKILERAEKALALDIRLGVSTEERNETERQILWMIRRTLENSRRSYYSI